MHPAWAEELRQRYLRGEASQFILHGNVFDVVAWEGKLVPIGVYLAEHLLGETKDVVVVFNLASGGSFVRRKADLAGFEDLIVQRQPSKFLPAMERVLRTRSKVALLVEYAETLAPAAEPALMSEEDRTAVVTLHRWSLASEIEDADNVVLLLAENLSELHARRGHPPHRR
jgi:transitional endoplasmic reticulum ATPase